MGEVVAQAMSEMGYRGAGTIEFLYENGEFYFIEMNTRLQVEHPVTEMISDIDLVREQIRIASGEGLSCTQEEVHLHGHAIECRINAEDPETFAPSPGLVKNYVAPGGMHVRVDSGLYTGYKVPPYYDSMIGKLIVYGVTREDCIMRLRRALEEYVVEGMKTTIPLHQKLVRDPDFLAGDYTIKWLEKWLARQPRTSRQASSGNATRYANGCGAGTSGCCTNNPGPDKNGRPQKPVVDRGSGRNGRWGRDGIRYRNPGEPGPAKRRRARWRTQVRCLQELSWDLLG